LCFLNKLYHLTVTKRKWVSKNSSNKNIFGRFTNKPRVWSSMLSLPAKQIYLEIAINHFLFFPSLPVSFNLSGRFTWRTQPTISFPVCSHPPDTDRQITITLGVIMKITWSHVWKLWKTGCQSVHHSLVFSNTTSFQICLFPARKLECLLTFSTFSS
jgi:hypothetical protein